MSLGPYRPGVVLFHFEGGGGGPEGVFKERPFITCVLFFHPVSDIQTESYSVLQLV